ncbi:MAG: 1-deoxy-D-xylulose-5-phosphate synthase [Phycisphaerales bacterium]|jgi:1-deoxy-D-xylulose-5-phosphate synthase|nr:1-deoxy-D-xylulose-5-phosphate synthase [Phycisphaerales bacterium]MBT7171931.1 1-deoxy-D-xylulose-5-phosphate synthase [Phycisphaerales bacterium]
MTEPNDITSQFPCPDDLRAMSLTELQALAERVRTMIVRTVSSNGGHLASNLGTIEMTIALHRVFDFSKDRLLWDVGHQCYAHKILTGRGERFDTLRREGGVGGFPSPDESEYDLFHTGHAGTAISTATGLAQADQMLGRDNRTVAMVGDASIVNGMSLEGLNNASLLKRQFLVVLNDNSMAIDKSRGALAEAMDKLRLTHTYHDIKTSTEKFLRHIPLGSNISDALKHLRSGIKSTLHTPRVFETLGFNYFGPIDGHDIGSLIGVLERVAELDRPVVLHVHTQKGRGCAYAVDDPCRFHSPAAHCIEGETPVFADKNYPSWTSVFADDLIAQAKRDERVVAITAAMPDGTGLAKFREVFPERTLDVGIGEEHGVAVAAGMAKAGLKPVVAIYSTFMQRAFDQVFHECALQKLPVVFCMDRAGLVGSDGAVHHGFSDIATMRVLPGVAVCAPADPAELSAVMTYALASETPVAIRYPRDEARLELPGECPAFVPGQSRTLREGPDATLLCYGTMVETGLIAAERLAEDHGLNVAVVNARFAKPLDRDEIAKRLQTSAPLLTIEDHAVVGGFGSAVLEAANELGLDTSPITRCGISDTFVAHASRDRQLCEVGLDIDSIVQLVLEKIAQTR